MRVLKIVSLSSLAGAFAGYLYGLWYCYQMHTDNPGFFFSLEDSIYYITTAFAGLVFGLLVGGIWEFVRAQSKRSGDSHEAA